MLKIADDVIKDEQAKVNKIKICTLILDILVVTVNAVLIFGLSTTTQSRRYKKKLSAHETVSYVFNDAVLVGNAMILVIASWMIRKSIEKQGGLQTKSTLIRIHLFNSIIYATLITINNAIEHKVVRIEG